MQSASLVCAQADFWEKAHVSVSSNVEAMSLVTCRSGSTWSQEEDEQMALVEEGTLNSSMRERKFRVLVVIDVVVVMQWHDENAWLLVVDRRVFRVELKAVLAQR